MLRWLSRFQVATTCFSCSPPNLNLVVTNFMFCIHVKQPLPPGNNPIAVNKYYYIIIWKQPNTYVYPQWAEPTLHLPPYLIKMHLILSSCVRLGLPSSLFPSGFPAKNWQASLLSPIRAACRVHLILCGLFFRITFDMACKSRNFLVRNFHNSSFTSSILLTNMNILLWVR